MWNTFLERGKELAEKAKAAAETLDKQIDARVGLVTSLDHNKSTLSSTTEDHRTLGFKHAGSVLFGGTSSSGGADVNSAGTITTSALTLSGMNDVRSSESNVNVAEKDEEEEDAWGDEDDFIGIDSSNDDEDVQGNDNDDEDEIEIHSELTKDNDSKLPDMQPLAATATGLLLAVDEQIIPSEDAVDVNENVNSATENEGLSEVDNTGLDSRREERVPDTNQQLSHARTSLMVNVDHALVSDTSASTHETPIETAPAEVHSESPMTNAMLVSEEGDDNLLQEGIALTDTPSRMLGDSHPTEEGDGLTDVAVHAGVEPIIDFVPSNDATADRTDEMDESIPPQNHDGLTAGIVEENEEMCHPMGFENNPHLSLFHSLGSKPSEQDYEQGQGHTSNDSLGEISQIIMDAVVTEPESHPDVASSSAQTVSSTSPQRAERVALSLSPAPTWNASPFVSTTTTTTTTTTDDDDHDERRPLQDQLTAQQEINKLLEENLNRVQSQLQQREEQLMSKTSQVGILQAEWESERADLVARISATKEEAKRRIQKIKERFDAVEAKLKAVNSDDAQQGEVIAALRSEGERLAMKQSEMEMMVRAAKTESRQLREQLKEETTAKENALTKIQALEAEITSTKESLIIARKGESQVDKLESDLLQTREELNRKGLTILSLEQQIKESKSQIKELKEELKDARSGAAIESQMQQEKLMKHHDDMIKDLELKLRSTEREAAVREDSLRHEMNELRKRWQDSVRRADTLSMDIQSSTAPLMRQMESVERQNRIRAAAAAELEAKLRSELEETVISNEKLTKECAELRTKFSRMDRRAKVTEDEVRAAQTALEEKISVVKLLEERLKIMEDKDTQMKRERADVKRSATEDVARVRNEMTQTIVESEERYRAQLDAVKSELMIGCAQKKELEQQLQYLRSDGRTGVASRTSNSHSLLLLSVEDSKPKRLQKSLGQAQILAGALGFNDEGGGDGNDDDDHNGTSIDSEDDDWDEIRDSDAILGSSRKDHSQRGESFAAMEELNSRLKAAKVELSALRKSLTDSEKSRSQLAEELGESRIAKEKLPLFEARVNELTIENREQSLEIICLREDIDEVRELYRAQLNALLEEKAHLRV